MNIITEIPGFELGKWVATLALVSWYCLVSSSRFWDNTYFLYPIEFPLLYHPITRRYVCRLSESFVKIMTQQIHICSDYIGLRFNAFISHVIGHILARSNSYPEWGLSNQFIFFTIPYLLIILPFSCICIDIFKAPLNNK